MKEQMLRKDTWDCRTGLEISFKYELLS